LRVGFRASQNVGDFFDGQDVRCGLHESLHSVRRDRGGS
jgi:hypothetical protein